MGREAGVTTCCVLTGETSLELINQDKENNPDFIINGIWDLLEIWN
jgi:ribonucleotide monophosphatase NagD (HAD superfamily)